MKIIKVAYFHLTEYPELKELYPHNSEHHIMDFNFIVRNILDAGYNVQIINGENTILIFIDKDNFKQR